jgi:phosphopantothenoylcysteine synthetase/decarboxylase
MFKVLVTSGGTKVPIDDVRSITNMSRGTFGSRIATEFLKVDDNIELTFLRAEGSCSPFIVKYDVKEGFFKNAFAFYNLHRFYKRNKLRIKEITYKTYADYARIMDDLMENQSFDATVLAAAVSDYYVYEG